MFPFPVLISENQVCGFRANEFIHHTKKDIRKVSSSTMIPRKPPRLPFPRLAIKKVEEQVSSGEITPEKSQRTINYLKSRYYNQNRLKEGEADPKLAGAILELAQGSHSSRDANFRTRSRSYTKGYGWIASRLCQSSIWRTYGCKVILGA